MDECRLCALQDPEIGNVTIRIASVMASGGTVAAIAMMEGERDTGSVMTKETAGTTTEVTYASLLTNQVNLNYYQ